MHLDRFARTRNCVIKKTYRKIHCFFFFFFFVQLKCVHKLSDKAVIKWHNSYRIFVISQVHTLLYIIKSERARARKSTHKCVIFVFWPMPWNGLHMLKHICIAIWFICLIVNVSNSLSLISWIEQFNEASGRHFNSSDFIFCYVCCFK